MLVTMQRLHGVLVLVALSGCVRSGAIASSDSVDGPVAPAFRVADSLVLDAVGKTIPGAVLVISRGGHVLHARAFGHAQLLDSQSRRLDIPPPMRLSTLFDLASVTKVMATTLAVMRLVDAGRVELDAPVWRYLPEFRGAHLDSITVRHLLSHSAGLVQWQPLYYHASNARETFAAIREMPLQWGVGEGRHYSDLGYMLLGFIVERSSGQRLDEYVQREFYQPLGLRSTTFLPRARGFTEFAATELGNGYERHMVYDSTFGYRYRGDPTAWRGWRGGVLRGEVNDGNSWYANGGVAGHAGLFATGTDLRVLLDLLVAGGTYGGQRYLSADAVSRFLTMDRYGHYLGWMMPRDLPPGSFMHTGFTGTWVLGVPSLQLSVVLLTNKQNMGTDAKGNFANLAPLQAAVARSIIAALAP